MNKESKKKFGITLTEETEIRLDFLCRKLGLSKSNAISFAINTLALEKYNYEEEDNQDIKI